MNRIGSVGLLFALGSIPAVFGVADVAYIVFTANAFALFGLRALFFLVKGLLDRLGYLSPPALDDCMMRTLQQQRVGRGSDSYLQRRSASLFLDWFHGIDGFDNDIPLVANAVAGMELFDDFAEARIGGGKARKIAAPRSARSLDQDQRLHGSP